MVKNKKLNKKKRISPNTVALIGAFVITLGGFFILYNFISDKRLQAYDYMNEQIYDATETEIYSVNTTEVNSTDEEEKETQKEENTEISKDEKAIELAKQTYGEEDGVTFSIEEKKNLS